MRKFEDSLPLQLLKARETTMSFFRPILQENDLTEQQWRVLRALYADDELDYKQVAKMCCILSPSLTGIVNRLEKMGYVQRRKDDNDHRRILLRQTPKAKDMFARLSPQVEKIYADFIEHFGAEKTKQLSELLNELSELQEKK